MSGFPKWFVKAAKPYFIMRGNDFVKMLKDKPL